MKLRPIATAVQQTLPELASQAAPQPSTLWRVVLQLKHGASHDRHAWEGWAWSSTDASTRAVAWWATQSGQPVRVAEVLQVGT